MLSTSFPTFPFLLSVIYIMGDRSINSDGFLIYRHLNEKDIFRIEVFTKNIFPKT